MSTDKPSTTPSEGTTLQPTSLPPGSEQEGSFRKRVGMHSLLDPQKRRKVEEMAESYEQKLAQENPGKGTPDGGARNP